jgi:hypothetical protein
MKAVFRGGDSLLTQEQRDVWIAVAATMKSKPRLAQCGALTGCQLFVKVNVALVNQGKPQVDLPAEYLRPKNVVRMRSTAPLTSPAMNGTRWKASLPSRKVGSGTGGPLLRYRSGTIVPPYCHHSNTLVGRSFRRGPQNRLRFPCRSHPPCYRGATRAVYRAPPSPTA